MKNKVLKKLLLILGILIAIFILVNVAWFISIKVPHDQYVKICKENSTGYDEMGARYYNDDYSFKVADIKYLDFAEEIRVIVAHVDPMIITYETTDTGEFVPTQQNAPSVAVYMYRNFWGKKRFVLDYTNMMENIIFRCAVDSDLDILRIGEVDYGGDDIIAQMRETIAANYDEMKAMYDFTYNLAGEK